MSFRMLKEGRNCEELYAHVAKGPGVGLQILIPIFPLPRPRLLGSVTLNKSLYLKEAVSSSGKKKEM